MIYCKMRRLISKVKHSTILEQRADRKKAATCIFEEFQLGVGACGLFAATLGFTGQTSRIVHVFFFQSLRLRIKKFRCLIRNKYQELSTSTYM